MANAKMKIIEQAKILFNERGYRNVSLREIAEAAGTTIGNLTYHFPQKEDLILSIQDDSYSDFLNEHIDFIDMKDGKVLLQKIVQSFTIAKQNRDHNEYFYRSIVELSQESTIIAKNIEDFRLQLYQFYYSSFMQLKECEIMRSDITEQQYQTLAYIIICMLYLWIQNTTPYYDKTIPTIEINDGLMSMIYPYLTKQGINIYTELI